MSSNLERAVFEPAALASEDVKFHFSLPWRGTKDSLVHTFRVEWTVLEREPCYFLARSSPVNWRLIITTTLDCYEHVIIVDKLLTPCLAFSSCLMDSWDLPLVTKPLLQAVSEARVPRRERKGARVDRGQGLPNGSWLSPVLLPRDCLPLHPDSFSCWGWPFRVSYLCCGLLGNVVLLLGRT